MELEYVISDGLNKKEQTGAVGWRAKRAELIVPIAIGIDFFCYILSGVEGLYQDKKVNKNENHLPA